MPRKQTGRRHSCLHCRGQLLLCAPAHTPPPQPGVKRRAWKGGRGKAPKAALAHVWLASYSGAGWPKTSRAAYRASGP